MTRDDLTYPPCGVQSIPWASEPSYYFDRVTLWRETALHPRLFAQVLAHCGGAFARRKRMKFNWQWNWRYDLYQPTSEALQAFAAGPHLINYIEITTDIPFSSADDRDDADDLLHDHLLIPRHSRKHGTRVHEGTRYSAARGARRNFVQYRRAFGKVTGECDVLHLECRVSRADACRMVGVASVGDVVGFDHRAFWSKVLSECYRIDLDRLGRRIRNRCEGTKRKLSDGFDVRWGSIVARASAINEPKTLGVPVTAQDLVDACGLHTVKPALVKFDGGMRCGGNCHIYNH